MKIVQLVTTLVSILILSQSRLGNEITSELQILYDKTDEGPSFYSQNRFLFIDNATESVNLILALNLPEVSADKSCEFVSPLAHQVDTFRFEEPAIRYPFIMKFKQTVFNAEIIEYWPRECKRVNVSLKNFVTYIQGGWNCIKVLEPKPGRVFLVFEQMLAEYKTTSHLTIKPILHQEGDKNNASSINQVPDLKSNLRKLCKAKSVAGGNPIVSIVIAFLIVLFLIIFYYLS